MKGTILVLWSSYLMEDTNNMTTMAVTTGATVGYNITRAEQEYSGSFIQATEV